MPRSRVSLPAAAVLAAAAVSIPAASPRAADAPQVPGAVLEVAARREGASVTEAALQGADAMHAWVQVWCGHDIGWIGFDPTNDMIASDDHVTLAVGRDYSDVAPMDGVIVAAGGQRITVSVSVTPVQASATLLPQNAL